MKYLTEYTDAAVSKALDEFGGFFAFSKAQFDEKKKEGVQYVSLFAGLIAPKENAKKLLDAIDKIYEDGMKQDLDENGKVGIIKRELANHEAYYTHDIDSTVDALEGYGITRDEVNKVFKNQNAKI